MSCNRNREWKLSINILVILISFISGCSGPQIKINAADAMFSNNPVKKVAIIAEGSVYYDVIWGETPKFGLEESKKAVEILVSDTKEIFLKKG